jgi:hypothetical protein
MSRRNTRCMDLMNGKYGRSCDKWKTLIRSGSNWYTSVLVVWNWLPVLGTLGTTTIPSSGVHTASYSVGTGEIEAPLWVKQPKRDADHPV